MTDEIPPEKAEMARRFHAASDQLPDKLSIMDMSVFFCGLMDAYKLSFDEKKDLILLMARAIAFRHKDEDSKDLMEAAREKLH